MAKSFKGLTVTSCGCLSRVPGTGAYKWAAVGPGGVEKGVTLTEREAREKRDKALARVREVSR